MKTSYFMASFFYAQIISVIKIKNVNLQFVKFIKIK